VIRDSEVVVVGEETIAALPAEMRGLRAGAIVFVGMLAANLGNYVFHLLTTRSLGPDSYSDVAALATLTGTIGLPLGGVQVFVARHAAAEAARGRALNGDGYVSSFTAAMLLAGCACTAVFLAVSPLVQRALSIHSVWAVVLTALFTLPSFVAPALIGAAQGRQRFLLVAFALGAPPLIRIVLVAVALVLGFGVVGAMGATLAAAVTGALLPFVALRKHLRGLAAWRPQISRAEIRALLPVVAGLLAITALSTDDLVVAKAVFSDHTAGLYGSASLIGRIVLYLPAAIATVLLPKVSSRVVAEQDTTDIVVQSVAVTAAFCAAATLVYTAAPHLIVQVAFGSKYESSAHLLWMFALAMTFYALLNVVLTYQLGHGASRTSWFLLGAAVCQGIVFAAVHGSPRQLLVVSMVVGGVSLLAHETLVAPTIAPALRGRGR
jgi:O-antigen/teichoic acid export membrane protein